MTLKQLQNKLARINKKTRKLADELYQKFDGRYRICINGLGEYELNDLSNFKTLAKGEQDIQLKMLEMLKIN